MTTLPLVAVVILNWNRLMDTVDCLRSLSQQTYPDYSVVIVDNGSTDGSVPALQARVPEVTLLANSSNLGYAEGNNIGIRYALLHGASYVLLLNNDTVVDPVLIEQLVSTAESDERIGAVGAKILYYSNPDRLWSTGCIVNFTETVIRMRGYRQLDRGQFDQVGEVDCVSGCAMLLRCSALQTIGLLDCLFSPAYFEDVDWCMRARRHGYQIKYAPSARVWHKVSMSGGGEYNLRERYLIGYNSVQFMKRYATLAGWLNYFVFAILSLPALYAVRVFQGRGRGVLVKGLGIWDGLRGRRRATYLG